MWKIVEKIEGVEARPNSSHFGNNVDPERFAKWVAVNDKLGLRVPLFIYLPKDRATCTQAIFSIHGKLCNANKYRNVFVNSMQTKNVLLISPRLDTRSSYPWLLNMGNMYRDIKAWRSKRPNPQEEWTFNVIDELYQLVKSEIGGLSSYSVFGHSAGSQFAHRLALFTDHPELNTIVAANPGWFTTIDANEEFPYGVKDVLSQDRMAHVLGKKLIILTGEHDTLDDGNVRKTTRAMKQGATRHERAKHFFEVGARTARSLGVVSNWKLVSGIGLDHSAKKAAPLAVPYLLGD